MKIGWPIFVISYTVCVVLLIKFIFNEYRTEFVEAMVPLIFVLPVGVLFVIRAWVSRYLANRPKT